MAMSQITLKSRSPSTDPSGVLSQDSQDRLLRFMSLAYESNNSIYDMRYRFEESDRAYARAKDLTEEQRKAQAANRAGNPTKLQNMQVPLVLESVENGVSFLTQVFLTEYPMFKFGAGPEDSETTMMWNTMVGEDQVHYGWVAEFNKAFRNSEKYNFAPIECDWCEERIYKPKSGNGPGGVSLEQMIWSGNKIKSIDPYNLVWDKRVPVSKVHTEGDFIGYVEQYSRIRLTRFLHSLGENRLKNDVKAYQAADWTVEHYTPDINRKHPTARQQGKSGEFDWTAWVTDTAAQNRIRYRNSYNVFILYARIMPYDFGIRAASDQTPDIWKLIAVNGVLVWGRPMTNAHDYLPIVIGQSHVDNLDLQSESNAETQTTFQEMVSALWNAKLDSARRRVTDRMLYNPLLVDPDHINSPNPSAKIPVKGMAYGRSLAEAVYQIPFHDENSQYWIQEVQGIAEWALRARGQNRVSTGQFQKGNKLQSEFDTVMSNAGSLDRTKAIMWEVYSMCPIKTIIKSNILQYVTQTTDRYNRKEKTNVQIDPVALRQAGADFEVGDGLLPIEKLIGADTLQQFFSYMASDPATANEFNKADLIVYLMQLRGANQLHKFKKPIEQLQYEQALGAWQNMATILSKNPNFDPNSIAKALGPMPKPPTEKPDAAQDKQQSPQSPQTVLGGPNASSAS